MAGSRWTGARCASPGCNRERAFFRRPRHRVAIHHVPRREEAQGKLEEHDKGPLMGARIIAAQQRVGHYGIASCGTMVALAKAVRQKELASLLAEALKDENMHQQQWLAVIEELV
ncbi:MAG: DUF892 family protein [Acetobacteraceae bacterium]|nr:DUF892 family protein [Acetobacteraceae bacterium]